MHPFQYCEFCNRYFIMQECFPLLSLVYCKKYASQRVSYAVFPFQCLSSFSAAYTGAIMVGSQNPDVESFSQFWLNLEKMSQTLINLSMVAGLVSPPSCWIKGCFAFLMSSKYHHCCKLWMNIFLRWGKPNHLNKFLISPQHLQLTLIYIYNVRCFDKIGPQVLNFFHQDCDDTIALLY